MSSSYNTEQELRELACKLREHALHLDDAADVLERVRETHFYKRELANVKDKVKRWLE